MQKQYALISFKCAALAELCTDIKDANQQKCVNKMCAHLGAYGRIEDRNGRPAYKQLHLDECEQRTLYFHPSGDWLVVLTSVLGVSTAVLRNTSKSKSVPISGWQHLTSKVDGVWCPVTGLTVSLLNDLSSVLCSDITIRAASEAARVAGDRLLVGTYSPLPGTFSVGRQMFENNITGEVLGVGHHDCWTVISLRKGFMERGSTLGMCPAMRIPTKNNWSYLEGRKRVEIEGSSDLIVSCARHSVNNTSSASAEIVPNIDEIMKYIEGEPSTKPTTKSKKKKKSQKSSKVYKPDSTIDVPSGFGTIVEDETAEVTSSDVSASDSVNTRKGNAKTQLEEKLKELNSLESDRKEIESKIRNNLVNFQNHCKRKVESAEKQKNSMTDCLMAISKKKEQKEQCDIEMERLVKQMNELKVKRFNFDTDLKTLNKKKTKLEKCTEKINEEFETEEAKIKDEKSKLQDALKANIKATENLTKVETPNKESTSNNRILKILSKTIQEKEKSIEEKEKDLECPVCLDMAQVPIFMCEEQHVICSSCRMSERVDRCPMCRLEYSGKPRRHRYAEKNLEDLAKLKEELTELKEERHQLATDYGAMKRGRGV